MRKGGKEASLCGMEERSQARKAEKKNRFDSLEQEIYSQTTCPYTPKEDWSSWAEKKSLKK